MGISQGELGGGHSHGGRKTGLAEQGRGVKVNFMPWNFELKDRLAC